MLFSFIKKCIDSQNDYKVLLVNRERTNIFRISLNHLNFLAACRYLLRFLTSYSFQKLFFPPNLYYLFQFQFYFVADSYFILAIPEKVAIKAQHYDSTARKSIKKRFSVFVFKFQQDISFSFSFSLPQKIITSCPPLSLRLSLSLSLSLSSFCIELSSMRNNY